MSARTLASRISVILGEAKAPTGLTIYHGTSKPFEGRLSREADKEGNQGHGPGIYFTTNPSEASGYAQDGTHRDPDLPSRVYRSKIVAPSSRILHDGIKPTMSRVHALISQASKQDQHDFVANFGYESATPHAIRHAASQYVQHNNSFLDAASQLRRDLYGRDTKKWGDAMHKVGYDAAWVERKENDGTHAAHHFIIYHPSAIEHGDKMMESVELSEAKATPYKKVLFRGTNDKEDTGAFPAEPADGFGHWFIGNHEHASTYGHLHAPAGAKSHVISARVSLNKPHYMTHDQYDAIRGPSNAGKRTTLRTRLLASGHDGIVIPANEEKMSRVTFKNPEVVVAFHGKSAEHLGMADKPVLESTEHPMIDVDGVPKHRNNSEGRPIHHTEEGIKNFHRWFGDSKVTDQHGRPKVLYHGTTQNFKSFDLSKANKESDHGIGVYATDSHEDVAHNYASEEGQDLTNKIEHEFDTHSYDHEDHDALRQSIKDKYVAHGGATIPVHMAMKNPVVFHPVKSQYISTTKVLNGLKKVEDSGEFHDADFDKASAHIYDHADGSEINVNHVRGLAETRGHSGRGSEPPLAYATDSEGTLASHEIVRRVFQHAGHDGIIDHTVGDKFTNMPGIKGATHYIAFKPTQVKSAIGNKGTFSKRNPHLGEAIRIDLSNIQPLVITEAKMRGDIKATVERLRKKKGWNTKGQPRESVLAAVDRRFIHHAEHYARMLNGGKRDDGSSYSDTAGVGSVHLVVEDASAVVVIHGSKEWNAAPHTYETTIRFNNFNKIANLPEHTWAEKARALMEDHMQVHCTCEAFRFYHAYAATKKGFALESENRPAKKNNPKNRGGVCKHLEHALRYLPANYAKIGSAMKGGLTESAGLLESPDAGRDDFEKSLHARLKEMGHALPDYSKMSDDELRNEGKRVRSLHADWKHDQRAPKGEQLRVLSDMHSRSRTKFDDIQDFHAHLENEHGVTVRPDGLIRFHAATPQVRSMVGNNRVVLHHATSSTLLPHIEREGLRVGKATNAGTTGSGVYLDTEGDPHGVYGGTAAKIHGGHPVSLTVVRRLSDLRPDPDDAHLGKAGRTQWITPHVPPEDILKEHFAESADGVNARKYPKPDWGRTHPKKILYHATAAPVDFSSFDTTKGDLGAHFGTLDQANHLANKGRRSVDGQHMRILPVRLNIKNPLRLKDVGSFHADAIADQLQRKGIITREHAKVIKADVEADWHKRKDHNATIRSHIEKAGYDGVVYKNAHEGEGDSYIAFHPHQIKSAIANKGKFDTSSPDMRESYAIPASKSGFEGEEGTGVLQPRDADRINSAAGPEDAAESGKVWVVQWAGGRAVCAFKSRSRMLAWAREQGEWAEIVSVKYGDPVFGKDEKPVRVQESSDKKFSKVVKDPDTGRERTVRYGEKGSSIRPGTEKGTPTANEATPSKAIGGRIRTARITYLGASGSVVETCRWRSRL